MVKRAPNAFDYAEKRNLEYDQLGCCNGAVVVEGLYQHIC